MKLVRYGPSHQKKPGIIDSEGKIHDLSGTVLETAAESLSPAALAEER